MDRNPDLLALKVIIIIAFLFFSCDQQAQIPSSHRQRTGQEFSTTDVNPYPQVGAIPLPAGYHRLPDHNTSFATWLRQVPLKRDKTVYLYNGKPKANQDVQYAVLDVSVGHQDLQQCADAVMRLRAEYLYAQHGRQDLAKIDFYTEQGTRLNYREWMNKHFCDSRTCFDDYLRTVFTYCSTRSLEKQLMPKASFKDLRPGDVLVQGGSPGHAMTIMDVAVDSAGDRIYLLSQGYMPAQDIHIVKNPSDPDLSPWYRIDLKKNFIQTPEWIFKINALHEWPKSISML